MPDLAPAWESWVPEAITKQFRLEPSSDPRGFKIICQCETVFMAETTLLHLMQHMSDPHHSIAMERRAAAASGTV